MSTYETDPASIAGIPIIVTQTSIIRGCNTIIIDGPRGRKPDAKPGGKVPLSFTMACKIAGALWRENAELLMDAISDGQTVLLEHPTWGPFNVMHRGPVRADQDLVRRRGETLFPLDLIEVFGEDSITDSIPPGAAVLQLTGPAVDLAVLDAGRISPSFADVIASAVGEVFSLLNGAVAQVEAQIAGVQSISGQIALVQGALNSLALAPGRLLSALSALFSQLGLNIGAARPAGASTIDGRAAAMTSAMSTIIRGADLISQPAPVQSAAQANKQEAGAEMMGATQAAAVIALHENLSTTDPSSASEAVAVVADVQELSRIVAGRPHDPELYAALDNLRALTVERLRGLTSDLPTIVTVERRRTTSALLLAYDRYGLARPDGDLDIERRNPTHNPAKLPPFTPLEVEAA